MPCDPHFLIRRRAAAARALRKTLYGGIWPSISHADRDQWLYVFKNFVGTHTLWTEEIAVLGNEFVKLHGVHPPARGQEDYALLLRFRAFIVAKAHEWGRYSTKTRRSERNSGYLGKGLGRGTFKYMELARQDAAKRAKRKAAK